MEEAPCAEVLSAPPDVWAGSVWGLAAMGTGFGGMIFALGTGLVLDHCLYVPVFKGFGLMPLVCAGIIWTLPGAISFSSLGLDFKEAS
jgi:MFS transporter, ACS family, hexuronate transporter